MEVALCSVILGSFIIVIALGTIVLFTLIVNGASNAKEMIQDILGGYRFILAMIVIMSLIMAPTAYLASKRAEAKARKECTCDCEACKKNAKKLEEVLKLVQEKLPEAK